MLYKNIILYCSIEKFINWNNDIGALSEKLTSCAVRSFSGEFFPLQSVLLLG